MDFTSSDPYVQIQSSGQEFKTAMKTRDLNPTFDETFDVLVYDKLCQTIEIKVFDYDFGKSDNFLGRTSIDLSTLVPYKTTSHEVRLFMTVD